MILNIIFFSIIALAGFVFFTRVKQVNFTNPSPLLPVMLYKNDLVNKCGISLTTLNKALRNSKISKESLKCIIDTLRSFANPLTIPFILKGTKQQLANTIGVTKQELENYFINPEEGKIASSLRNLMTTDEIYGGERIQKISVTSAAR
jgi:DNA-binding XRE family transcriptional regulator